MDHLEHYGILGMKWGIRNPIGSNGLVRRSPSEDYLRSLDISRKSTKELSNEEINFLSNRLQLERRYADLAAPPKQEISRGRQFANQVMTRAGTTVATAMATTAVLYTAKKVVGATVPNAAEVFWPNQKK